MKRYPPTKKILQMAPQYEEELRSYFDLNDEILLPISNNTQNIFFSILRPGDFVNYKVTYNKKDLSKLYGVTKTYVLGVHTKIHDSSFKFFTDSLFNVIQEDKKIDDVDIDIKYTDESLSIEFTYDFMMTTYFFNSLSVSFSECFLYEYFKKISSLDYKDKFSFSKSKGFYIKGSKISLIQFIEEHFGNSFGFFESKNDLAIDAIFDDNYDWKGTMVDYADQLNTNRNEFLLPFDTVCIPFSSKQHVENKLSLSFKEK